MSKKKCSDTQTRNLAIVCLTIICSVALVKGIDSALIGTVAAIIGGIAGYTLKKVKEESKK